MFAAMRGAPAVCCQFAILGSWRMELYGSCDPSGEHGCCNVREAVVWEIEMMDSDLLDCPENLKNDSSEFVTSSIRAQSGNAPCFLQSPREYQNKSGSSEAD